MRKTAYILTIAGLMITTLLPAQQYRGVVSFHTGELRESGDSLIVRFGIQVRSSAVTECQSMRLTPELASGSHSLEMPYVEIQSRHRGRMNERWESLRSKKYSYQEPYATVKPRSRVAADTVVEYRVGFPYEQWMDDARLVIHQEVISCRNEFRLFTFSMNGRVELESREPYLPRYEVALVEPEREEKRRARQGQAFLDFQVGRSVILPDFRRNPEELAKIHDAFDDIRNNADVQIMGLYVEGFASPEGRYTLNEKLSKERASALKDYMRDRYGLPESMFKVDSTPEDWDGLTALINSSDIAYKDEILSVIETTAEPDARESKLMRLRGGAPWRTMLRDMFPMLRRVEYQIDYTVKDFTVEEITALIGVKDDLLSHREFYLGTRNFGKGTPQYEEIIIDRVLRFFPDDPVALNNAAALLIEREETGTARRYLERAGESPAVWNNLGILHLLANELDSAEELLLRAAGAGVPEAEKNLEELRLKREDNIRMERYKNR